MSGGNGRVVPSVGHQRAWCPTDGTTLPLPQDIYCLKKSQRAIGRVGRRSYFDHRGLIERGPPQDPVTLLHPFRHVFHSSRLYLLRLLDLRQDQRALTGNHAQPFAAVTGPT